VSPVTPPCPFCPFFGRVISFLGCRYQWCLLHNNTLPPPHSPIWFSWELPRKARCLQSCLSIPPPLSVGLKGMEVRSSFVACGYVFRFSFFSFWFSWDLVQFFGERVLRKCLQLSFLCPLHSSVMDQPSIPIAFPLLCFACRF